MRKVESEPNGWKHCAVSAYVQNLNDEAFCTANVNSQRRVIVRNLCRHQPL